MKPLLVAALAFFTWLAACGGEAALGESCGESGADGECASGAVCGKASDGSEDLLCLTQCTDDAQCGDGQACNGVEGTNVKGCRTKTK